MMPPSPLTQRERDALQEQLVDALLDHAAASTQRHSEILARLDRIDADHTRGRDILTRLDLSAWGLLTSLVTRATETTVGTVALLTLIAVLCLIAAAVSLGADHVLEIVAGRVSLGTPATPATPETP